VGISWAGNSVNLNRISQVFDFFGGPGRTRTCNQTVMSGLTVVYSPGNHEVLGHFMPPRSVLVRAYHGDSWGTVVRLAVPVIL
jgi:hypothetical protein